MSTNIRFVSVLALAAFAAASQAAQIFIDSQVGAGMPAVPFSNYTEVVDLNNSQSPFSSIVAGTTATLSFTGGAGSTAVYTPSAGNSVTFSFNSATTITTGNSIGFQSIGTVTAASGSFAGFLNQTGVIVTSSTNTSNGSNDFTVNGSLTPTPEPASIAALGVGAVALLRRRRKA